MARKKTHTVQDRANKKRSRGKQLQEARKQRKLEGCESEKEQQCNLNRVLSDTTHVVPSTSTSNEFVDSNTASTSTSVPFSDVLGGKTRSQYKQELALQRAVPSNSTERGTAEETRSTLDSELESRAIVDLQQFNNQLACLICPLCYCKDLFMRTVSGKRKGFAIYSEIVCRKCEEIITSSYLASQVDTGRGERPFHVNKQGVSAALSCGLGATTFNNLCANWNLQGVHPSTFHSKANELYKELPSLEKFVFSQAVSQVRKVNSELSGIPASESEDQVIDITVSYDGTWLTRGHSSHIGVGCVVDVVTGLCIDAHVMSTYCQACETTGKALLRDKPLEYAAWAAKHLDECDNNYAGSSGMMEVEAARVLWKRSIDRHKLRYTTVVSDGDSKTLKELNEVTKPYGENVLIEKEECVNHVGKRLGTALRNVVNDSKKRGVTLGGRGVGRLTQNTMRKLQIYYNRAIIGKTSVEDMKKGVLASIYHGFSTDENPRHDFCPTGPGSWCFFQSAIAQDKPPGPHDKLVKTPLNFELLSPYLLPIYDRLTDQQLLQRCVKGRTQNANECLHSTIWARCAKDNFACRRRVRFAVVTAAGEFNFGNSSSTDVSSFYGFQCGEHMERLGAARMAKRVRNSVKRVNDKKERRREKRRVAKQKRQEELMQLEGGAVYGAGLF